jgi:Ca2+-binding EF-hand superfamily protein
MKLSATICTVLRILLLLTACTPSMAADGFDAIDADHSGAISEGEAQAAGRSVFQHVDRNSDGKLSNDEVQSRLVPQVLKAADPDADGALSPEEYSALVTARVKSTNANADGEVDHVEFGTAAGKLLRDVIEGEQSAD